MTIVEIIWKDVLTMVQLFCCQLIQVYLKLLYYDFIDFIKG